MRVRFATRAVLVLAFGLAWAVAGGAGTPRVAMAFEARKADQSVVRVMVFEVKDGRRTGRYGSGTGFVIDDEHVLTNEHVVDDTMFTREGSRSEMVVVDGSRSNLRAATAVWRAPDLDLALVRVPGLTRPVLTLSSAAPADYPDKGQAVWAIGYPGIADRGMQSDEAFASSTVTQGVVGKVVNGRNGQSEKLRPIIQHNASINKGNSGGPLFDNCGVVVGVNTFATVSTLEITKDARGNPIAAGMPNTGVYFSPHIANFIEATRSESRLKSLRLRLTAAPCVGPAAAAAAPAEPLGLPVWVYGMIGLVTLLALTSTFVAFRKGATREVVRVVESYSHYIRRKGGPAESQPMPRPAAERRRDAAPAAPEPPRRRAAPERAPERAGDSAAVDAAAAGDWVLAGSNKERSFRLDLTAAELARAAASGDHGLVLGRSRSLSDLALDDPTVSRRHAKFATGQAGLTIEDMGSAYGTKVNGKKLAAHEPTPVAAGDRLTFGGVSLELKRG